MSAARGGVPLGNDRKIVDDLWANVAAHMWACKYGIRFFEDRRGRGVNYNLSIEVGGMLTTGRRLALLGHIDRIDAHGPGWGID